MTTPTVTISMVRVYRFYNTLCTRLGITQSLLMNKTLQGTRGAISTTGNVVYTGPGPTTNNPASPTRNSNVWAVWEPLRQRGDRGDDAEAGRTSVPYMRGSCPVLGD